jgi:hypothetical protein
LPMTALINKEQNDFMMRLEIDPKKLPQLWTYSKPTNTTSFIFWR